MTVTDRYDGHLHHLQLSLQQTRLPFCLPVGKPSISLTRSSWFEAMELSAVMFLLSHWHSGILFPDTELRLCLSEKLGCVDVPEGLHRERLAKSL